MPVAPVAFEVAEPHGQLVQRRLDLLQAQDIRLGGGQPGLELGLAGAQPVDVPGGDLQSPAPFVFVFTRTMYMSAVR